MHDKELDNLKKQKEQLEAEIKRREVRERIHKARRQLGNTKAPKEQETVEAVVEARQYGKPPQIISVCSVVQTMPPSARRTYIRAMAGNSPTSAIRGFCFQCTMYERDAIRNCTSWACPLHPYRPFQTNPERQVKDHEQLAGNPESKNEDLNQGQSANNDGDDRHGSGR